MKIQILDPALSGVAGHHPDLCLRTAKYLRQAGHDVTIYANRNLQVSQMGHQAHGTHLVPYFSDSPYVPPHSFDQVAGELIHFLQFSQVLAGELNRLPNADAWVWPTFFSHQLHACALHGFPKLIAGCIHLPVDFMTPEYGHGWWRYAHLVATERKLKLNLGSIEPEVIETYANVFPPNTLHILPSYFDGWTRTSEDRSPLKIGFFGHQRREKGTDFLDQLIERLLPSYQVVVHDSSGSLTTGFRHPNLELHGYVDNLAILMSTCDIVILPYIATQYKAKGSGILWDAVASGIPIVAPSNSTPGRFVSKHQLGTVFENDTVHSVMDATERLVKSLGDFKLRCQDFAQDWRRKNGFEQFMRSFLLNHLSAQPPKSVTFKLGTIQYRI